MDNEEAKFILRAYRPSGADADNQQFGLALAQAMRDPELRKWFKREQAYDKSIAGRIKSVPVPWDLREAILAGGKMSATQRFRWPSPAYVGLAASFLILGLVGSSIKFKSSPTDWNALIATVVDDVSHAERHGSHGESVTNLAGLLANSAIRLSTPLAINLRKLKTDGCRTLTIAGHEMVEICFERNGGKMHLYVMRRPSQSDLLSGPQFTTHGNIRSVLWTDHNNLYVMASVVDEETLKALL